MYYWTNITIWIFFQYRTLYAERLPARGTENRVIQSIKRQNWQMAISIDDCGIIPFVYAGHVIDSYCLNNKMMSSPSIRYRYDKFADWLLLVKKPQLIILTDYFDHHRTRFPPPDHAILSNQALYRFYHPIKRFFVALDKKA